MKGFDPSLMGDDHGRKSPATPGGRKSPTTPGSAADPISRVRESIALPDRLQNIENLQKRLLFMQVRAEYKQLEAIKAMEGAERAQYEQINGISKRQSVKVQDMGEAMNAFDDEFGKQLATVATLKLLPRTEGMGAVQLYFWIEQEARMSHYLETARVQRSKISYMRDIVIRMLNAMRKQQLTGPLEPAMEMELAEQRTMMAEIKSKLEIWAGQYEAYHKAISSDI